MEELMGMDLLEVANIQKIWETTVMRHQMDSEKVHKERVERDKKTVSIRLIELEDQFKGIVINYVGKVGRGIVDKEISDLGGNSCIIDEVCSAKLLGAIERAAKLLISGTNTKLMMEKLSAFVISARSEF
jgi:hypothetical protein